MGISKVELEKLIRKFDNKKIEGLDDLEQMMVFNSLKDLQLYDSIGTIAEFIEYKSVCKSVVKKENDRNCFYTGG